MPRYSTAFGMDVHLRSTTVCALDAETGEAVTRRFRGNPWGEVAEWMSGFPGPSLAAYESGYLGFAPQRELSALGVDCVVAAVSKVPRSAADLSSKNDRNDAARMAKAILSHAPGEGERRHRRRAREVAVGPRHDVQGGRRIDIAPVPASRAAFGDTPVLAVRAAVAAFASTDLGNPRRRRGFRAAGAVYADMRLSRRRRRHAGGGPGRVQRQAPPTDCTRSAGPLWLLTADWVI